MPDPAPPIKRNLNVLAEMADGSPIKRKLEDGSEVQATWGWLAYNAVCSTLPESMGQNGQPVWERLTWEQGRKFSKIGRKCLKKEEIELTADEVRIIQDRFAKAYPHGYLDGFGDVLGD